MNFGEHLLTIGHNIRTARQVKGWTQQQLAEEAGLRLATVSDLENGKLNFEINTLVRLANALDVYLDIKLHRHSKVRANPSLLNPKNKYRSKSL